MIHSVSSINPSQTGKKSAKELEVLSLEVTTRCNQSCNNCFALVATEHAHMELETALQIAREGRELGFPRIHITGGEALLWKSLFPFIDSIAEMGYPYLLINTNATLLDKPVAEKLRGYRENGMDVKLSISINGPEEHHERVRGKDSHTKALNGLETALEHDIPVEIFTTVGRSLLSALPHYTAELLERFPKIGGISFIQLHRVTDDLHDLNEELLTPHDFIIFVRTVAMLSLNGLSVSILDQVLANVVARKNSYSWFPPSLELSRYGKPVILRNGNLTAHHSSRLAHGNYTPGTLGTILTSESYLTETNNRHQECLECPYKELCHSHGMSGPSEALYNQGDLSVPFCRKVLDAMKVQETY